MPSFDASRSSSDRTVIARGVRVEGDFSSQGDVIIEGEVTGHVSTTGLLTIGPEAKLKAEVTANDAMIAGLIEGTVTVKRRLDIASTARIAGDITCETISVEAGAVLNGKMSIGQTKPTESAPIKLASE